ncbi:TPA: hypothetical protein ACG7ZL_005139, partial [Escherichia coli]
SSASLVSVHPFKLPDKTAAQRLPRNQITFPVRHNPLHATSYFVSETGICQKVTTRAHIGFLGYMHRVIF